MIVLTEGLMGVGKTKALIDYYEKCQLTHKILVLVPEILGTEKVESRDTRDMLAVKLDDPNLEELLEDAEMVMIDECQFLTEEQIERLCKLEYSLSREVRFYGLTHNYKGELFEPTLKIHRRADKVISQKIRCTCCHDRFATINALVLPGHMDKYTLSGDGINIEHKSEIPKYRTICTECWNKGLK